MILTIVLVIVGLQVVNGVGSGVAYIIDETRECNNKGQMGVIEDWSIKCVGNEQNTKREK